MNKSASANRPTLVASIALAGAVAALVVALLTLAPTARGGAGTSALYPRTIKLTDSKIAAPPSSSVAGSRSIIASRTGCRVRIDRPKSPCTARPSQAAYCTGIGWSRDFL